MVSQEEEQKGAASRDILEKREGPAEPGDVGITCKIASGGASVNFQGILKGLILFSWEFVVILATTLDFSSCSSDLGVWVTRANSGPARLA